MCSNFSIITIVSSYYLHQDVINRIQKSEEKTPIENKVVTTAKFLELQVGRDITTCITNLFFICIYARIGKGINFLCPTLFLKKKLSYPIKINIRWLNNEKVYQIIS